MRHLLTTITAAGLLFTAGCTSGERAEVRQEVRGVRQQVEGAAENARQAAADAAIAGKVKTALASRKGIETKHIDVDVQNGRAVLKGDVASAEQAELAERVALETEGVTSVDNQLMLRVPARRGDFEPAPPADSTPGGPSESAAPPVRAY